MNQFWIGVLIGLAFGLVIASVVLHYVLDEVKTTLEGIIKNHRRKGTK